MWTTIIGVVLFSYVGYMVYRYILTTKKALQGKGCDGCSGNCNACDIVNIKF